MDFWINAGLSYAIALVSDKQGRKKWYRVFAKLHAKLEVLAVMDQAYERELQQQRDKGATI